MKWIQNSNLAKLVAFFVIAVVMICTVSFAVNGWQSFTDNDIPAEDQSNKPNEDNTVELPSEDIEVVLPTPMYFHPITGMETTLEKSTVKPLCFVFSSSDPLYGISSSYLTIELPTEYGNTRLLCFTDDAKTLGKIGSLAATRGYISNLAKYFGGVLLSYGCDDAVEYTYDAPTSHLDFLANVGYCYSEYNSFVYSNGDLINAFLTNEGVNQSINESMTLPYSFPEYGSEIALTGGSAVNISVSFSDNNSTQITYSSNDKCYLFSKNSTAKTDLLNDKQIKYDNVLILFANSTTHESEDNTQMVLDTYTSGSGIYAFGGQYVSVTWQRDASGDLVFLNQDGERLSINRGSIYIGFVKSSLRPSVKVS